MIPPDRCLLRARDVIDARYGPGTLIFETDDVQATYDDLTARGVEFIQAPMERPYGIDAAFRDPFGNSFRVAQRV